MQYANVIVDISASEVDRLFSYAVPEGLSLLPGHQVSVPFGPRKVEGFVVSLSDTTKVPPEKIRSVLGLVRPEPVILPEMMELALWMKERYLCNLVDALRLMLPAEMRGARVRKKPPGGDAAGLHGGGPSLHRRAMAAPENRRRF